MAALHSGTLVAAAPLAPRRPAAAPSAAPAVPPAGRLRRRGGRPRQLAVAASGHRASSEADLYQVAVGVPPPPPPPPSRGVANPLAGQPLYVTVPAALAGLIAVLRTARFIKKRLSNDHLAERGFKKGGVADDRAYTRAIRGMKHVQLDELSEEQIAAARRRRQREVAKDMAPLDLDKIELPENHPFAVRKKLAPEEEELQRSRLSARRGLSADDMRKLREQQALAEQMEAEEEARRAAARQRQG